MSSGFKTEYRRSVNSSYSLFRSVKICESCPVSSCVTASAAA